MPTSAEHRASMRLLQERKWRETADEDDIAQADRAKRGQLTPEDKAEREMIKKARAEATAARAAEQEAHFAAMDRDSDRANARNEAVAQAMVAIVAQQRPEVAAAFAEDGAPRWFQRIADDCADQIDNIAKEAAGEAERRAYDETYVATFATAFPAKLAEALAAYDALDPAA